TASEIQKSGKDAVSETDKREAKVESKQGKHNAHSSSNNSDDPFCGTAFCMLRRALGLSAITDPSSAPEKRGDVFPQGVAPQRVKVHKDDGPKKKGHASGPSQKEKPKPKSDVSDYPSCGAPICMLRRALGLS
ncbi:MAG: hypothetical protein Q9224_007268, partial [Gallowayella concinna]